MEKERINKTDGFQENFLYACGRIFWFATVFSLLVAQNALADTVPQKMFYIVKNGDSLASILRSLNLRPLYTANGSLAKLFVCNDIFKDVNRVDSGTVLHFEFAMDSRLRKYIGVLSTGEIIVDKAWMSAQFRPEKFRKLKSELYKSGGTPFRFICQVSEPQTIPPAISKNEDVPEVEGQKIAPVLTIIPPTTRIEGEPNDENITKLLNL